MNNIVMSESVGVVIGVCMMIGGFVFHNFLVMGAGLMTICVAFRQRMNQNVMYVILGLLLVLTVGFILQDTVINSLSPNDSGKDLIVPDTHQKPQPDALQKPQPSTKNNSSQPKSGQEK